MVVQSGFFQSDNGDRIYRSDEFAGYFASFIGNGIFSNPSTNLQVIANNGLTVNVSPGRGWINGYFISNTDNFPLTLTQADGVLSRIDRIVFGLNFNTRSISLYVKQGIASGNPIAPTLVRNANIHELALADIRINAGLTNITQSQINDTRLNNNLCGVVTGLVQQVDVTTIYNQYDQQLQDFIANLNAVLDGDAQANILSRIDALTTRLNNHEALNASTTQRGHVTLNNATNSTSTTQAATANAVRLAYNRADAAFQQANDIKTRWAGVVGSPLIATDTQAQLESKTQDIKNNLAGFLTTAGQSSSGTETLNGLVNKVGSLGSLSISNIQRGQITLNTTLNGGQVNLNINPVDLSRTVLFFSYSTTGTFPRLGVSGTFQNNSIINFYHRAGGSSGTSAVSFVIEYFVLEFQSGIRVQHFNNTLATTRTFTIESVNTSRTVLLGSSSGADDFNSRFALTNETSVLATLGNTNSASSGTRVGLQVIEFL